jgi:FKBP-type peptidyl-prolyl cis-trans isomerase
MLWAMTGISRTVGLVALAVTCALAACTERAPRPLDPQPERTLESGVKVHVLRRGLGEGCKKGEKITVHFKGSLLDGGVFDDSRARQQPFSFWVGEGQVVEGLDEGLLGAAEGELRVLTIPPNRGYGSDRKPNIPPNSTLIFEVELLDIR